MRVAFFHLFAKKPGWLLLAACLLMGMLLPALGHAVSPPPGTLIVNTAEISYKDANGNSLAGESNQVSTAISGGAVLLFLKLENTDPVAIGGQLTYTIQFHNTGNAAANNVTITDTLSDYLIFQSASNNGIYTAGPPEGGMVTWDIGTLDSGELGAVTITTRVKTPADYPEGDPQTIAVGTQIPNNASINAAEASAAAAITTTVSEGPNLVLTKLSTGGTVTPGGTITYSLHYENIGNQPATNVRIQDTLPQSTSYVDGSITGSGSINGSTLSWNIGIVEPATDGEMSFQVRVSPLADVGQIIRNTGVALSSEEEPKSSNTTENHVAETATSPSLAFTKLDSPDPVFVNNPITYTLEITNDGTDDLTEIEVRDTIPAQTTFVAADEGGACVNNAANECIEVVWQIDQLAPGETKTFLLTVKISPDTAEGTIISNSAVAYAREIPFPSPTAATTVSARTSGVVKFLDADWNPIPSYSIGDTIYLQVTDLDRNTDPFTVETVSIVLEHKSSGDRETIILTETGPNTGIFRSSIPSTGDPAISENQVITVSEDTSIIATYTDPLDAEPISIDSALIDPFGVVFDSISGAAVEGAVVTLIDESTGLPADLSAAATGLAFDQDNPVTTAADGAFQFAFVPPGTYYFTVAPPGEYVFPSVIPDGDLPGGFIIMPESRGASFTLAAGDPALNFDIPVDPEPAVVIVRKEANKTTAAIGDLITYTITFSNSGVTPVNDLQIIDTLPHNIQYLENSTKFDGDAAPNPSIASRTLTWQVPVLAPAETLQISYVVVVGVNTPTGDAENKVSVTGTSAGAEIISNTARETVKIIGGIFTEQAVIIGKVFEDRNGDGIQNTPEKVQTASNDTNIPAGQTIIPEKGIPGVVLFMEDGTRVETDKNGKYSIQPVNPGTHVLRLDETTLPAGFVPISIDNRFMGDAASRFVDIRPGLIFKANFAVRSDNTSQGNNTVPVPAPSEEENAGVTRQEAVSLEERTMDMTRDLAFIEPLDKSTVQHDQIKVTLKAPLGAAITLYINEQAVDASKIGTKITNTETDLEVYEFIGVKLTAGATNTLRADMKDPFGNPRDSVEISVNSAGSPAQIVLTPDKKEIPADGKSTSQLTILIQDAEGNTLQYPRIVTVKTDNGTILTKDADPNTPGLQIAFKNNEATVALQSDYKTGEATVTALFDDLKEQTTVYFIPALRDLIVVGLGEVTIGQNDNTRGAFFAKGDIGKGVLMTATYDSDKEEDGEDFFRADDLNLESEEKYPILGDESKQGYEALSRDKLYLKLEKNRSSLLYGDYHTELNDSKLNAYTRTYNGFKTDIVTDKLELRSFISHTDQSQVVEALPGQGISGYYTLTATQVVEGSERVTLEIRDRFRLERVLESTTLTRYADYSIDYMAGTILFKEPVPSYDDSWNPVYIIIRYESEGSGEKFYNYGGRVAIMPASWVNIGLTGVVEENAVDDFQLFGTDITFNLPRETVIKAEYSQTNALFDLDSLLQSESGEGWTLGLETSPMENFNLSAYYQKTSNFFGNMLAVDATRGREKYGMDFKYSLKPDFSLYSNLFEEKDTLNDMSYSHISLGAEKKFTNTSMSLEVSHEESDDDYIPPSSSSTRSPFDISEETPEDLTAVKAGIKTKIRPNLTLLASHKQNISGSEYSLSQAGLDYQLNPLNRLYIRQEYGRFDDRDEMRTVFGGETKVIKNTVAFNEYRLDNGADGDRNQQIIGLRNKLMLSKNITGNFSLENIRTLSGEERSDKTDAFAVTAGVEYLPLDTTKITSRLEYRVETNESDAYSWLAEVGLTHKLNDDYSLLLKERYAYQNGDAGYKAIRSRLQLGMAYRPTNNDRFHGLLKTEWKHEKDESASDSSENTFIFAGEGVYQLNSQTQLIGKYAGKYVENNGWDSYTDLIAARILYDLTDRIDLGAEYRFLTSHTVDTHAHGGSLEAGYRLFKNFWATLGYSFDSFDDDLVGDYNDEGWYLRFRFKFDEHLLEEADKYIAQQSDTK